MLTTKATHIRWSDHPAEQLNDKLVRRYVYGTHLTLAQFHLAKGCLVPRHAHESEQFCHVLQGCLRFRLGDDGAEVVDIAAGEVLTLPSNLPHSAEALEDSIVCDVFAPIRSDWVDQSDSYLRR
jgi:quercetin dioxygenase-like cupin family protein